MDYFQLTAWLVIENQQLTSEDGFQDRCFVSHFVHVVLNVLRQLCQCQAFYCGLDPGSAGRYRIRCFFPMAIHDEFPGQGMQQANFSRKKKFNRETRINTGDSQSAREFAGKEEGICK